MRTMIGLFFLSGLALGAARAEFPRSTPLADWQSARTQELFEMSARLNSDTYVARLRQEDYATINARLEAWKPRTTGPSAGKYDPGWGTIDLYYLWAMCREKLTPAAQAKILEVMEEYTKPGEYAYGSDFSRMVNTNHPTNAAMALVLAGQWMGKPERLARGRMQLQYLLDWLRDVTPADMPEQFAERRKEAQLGNADLSGGTGDIDEYNSPTYQAVTLTGLAAMSNWADDPEIRLKARLMQEHLFLLTAARHDPGVRLLCGPYSRSYPMNTAGVVGNLYYIFHRYLKTAPPLDPELANKEWGPGSADIFWIPKLAAMPFYFPEYLREIADNKAYPYSVYASSKSGNWGDYPYDDGKTRLNAPGGRSDLTSYLTADYCLGSSSRYYGYATQNENCILYYRKRPVEKPQDRKFMIVRYLTDGRAPFDNTRDGLADVYQHENKAIVLLHPAMRPAAKRMRAWVGFFDDYDPIEEVYVNNVKVDQSALPLNLRAEDVLFVHDGPVHVAVRPLPGQNLGVKGSVMRLEREFRCLGLSAYNYEADEALPLSLQKVPVLNPVRFIRSGFIIEVGDRRTFPTADAFRKHVLATSFRETVKDEKVREVRYTSGATTMDFSYDMDNDRLLSRMLNGKPAAAPPFACPDARMEYTGAVTVHGATLTGETGQPLTLAAPRTDGPFVATKTTDKPGPLALTTAGVSWKTPGFGCGQVRLYPGKSPRLEIDRLVSVAPFFIKGRDVAVIVNGAEVTNLLEPAPGRPGWLALPAEAAPPPPAPSALPAGTLRTNPRDGAELVWVPGTRESTGRNVTKGAFLLGTTPLELTELARPEGGRSDLFRNELPVSPVTLDGFWLYRTEVTNAQYERFCREAGYPAPSYFQRGACPAGAENLPVVRVTWPDAGAYARWAGAQLPTEAQWEWAARGPERRLYSWGDRWEPTRLRWAGALAGREFTDLRDFQAWYAEWVKGKAPCQTGPSPVGSFPAGISWCGALDLAGNVWEFCRDRYYPYSASAKTNPLAPDTTDKSVTRGGCWMDFLPRDFRGAARWMTDGDAGFRFSDTGGFRCGMELLAPD